MIWMEKENKREEKKRKRKKEKERRNGFTKKIRERLNVFP